MRSLLVLLIALCLVIPVESSVVGRSNLGLYGGQIENMATFDMPGTPNRVYADVRGANGLYFTDDVGLNWTLSISGEETYGVATDSSYVYVIVNGEEVWRSDGADGASWTTILAPGISPYRNEYLSFIAHDGTRLLAGAAEGVLYMNPTGLPGDWVRNVVHATTPDEAVAHVTSRPSDPNTLLAIIQNHIFPQASSNQLYESVDAGTTWTSVTLPASITTAIEIVGVDPANPDDVYIGGDSADATMYLNRSYLDPTTWTDITPSSFQSRYPQLILFHNGLTWTTANSYDVNTGTWTPFPDTTIGTHPNDGALVFDPDDPAVVFISSDVGVAVSSDSAATFEERNNNIEGVEVFDVDVDAFTKDIAVVASKSGLAITDVFQKPPTPADWNYPVFPHGNGGPPLTAVAIVQGSTQEFVVGDNSETIFLSEDGGVTWRETYRWLATPIESRSTVTDIDSAHGSNTLYACIGFWEEGNDGIVVRSDDRGKTWVEATLANVYPNALEVVGTNLIYVAVGNERDPSSGSNKGIYVSNDSGATWSQVLVGGTPLNGIVTDLAQDPINPAIQYATLAIGPGMGGAVLRLEYDATGLNVLTATDLSSTYSGPSSDFLTAIETDNTGNMIFAGEGSDIALFDVPTSTWSMYYSGLNGETIYSLYWDALVSGTSTGFYAFDPSTSVQDWHTYSLEK